MAAADTVYAPGFAGPEFVERGRLNTLACSVFREGVAVLPTSGTVTILRPDGTTLATASVAVVPTKATYQLLSATVSAESFGEGWIIEWALLMPDGVVHTFRRDMVLARRSLYPVVSDQDLIRRHSDLTNLRPSTMSSYQSYLDDAWFEIIHRLRQGGSLPQLVCSPEDFRYVHMYRALELIFRDFMVTASADAKWTELATEYKEQVKAAWGSLSLKYDTNEDGIPETQRRPASPVTFLAVSTGWGGDY